MAADVTPANLARLCREAYREPPTFEAGGTEARLTIEAHGVTVVAFRGTTFDGLDIIKDLRTMPWWSRELGCWVHAGFLKGVRGVWPLMADALAQIQGPLILTGHSKGAAEAAVCAAFMKKLLRRGMMQGTAPTMLVTFGAPRVGFPGFCRITAGIPGERYVNGIDIVPTLPPPGILLRFRHDREETGLHQGKPDFFLNHRIADYEAAAPTQLYKTSSPTAIA